MYGQFDGKDYEYGCLFHYCYVNNLCTKYAVVWCVSSHIVFHSPVLGQSRL
jgi:hypothetical protein